MVFWALEHALGGEIFVPKIPSYRVMDVAHAVGPRCKHQIVGIRPGEKLHEEMITESDSPNTIDLGPYYAILSASGGGQMKEYLARQTVQRVDDRFSYNSGSNTEFLSVERIRALIRDHIDPTFEPA